MKISIGQALLLLLDCYQKELNDNQSAELLCSLELQLTTLKKLYLLGVENDADQQSLNFFIAEGKRKKILSDYEISFDDEIISEDPTRRYFETQLAYTTLQHALIDLSLSDLTEHYRLLHDEFFPASPLRDLIDKSFEDEKFFPEFHHQYIKMSHAEYVTVIKQKLNAKELTLAEALVAENILEYQDAIKIVRSKDAYPGLEDRNRQKLELLVKCALLSIPVLNCFLSRESASTNQIYKSDFHFSSAYRGRVDKKPEVRLSSSHLGLLKRNMPIPRFDVARRSDTSTYARPADRNFFDAKAEGPRDELDKRVHPYSCGIGGQTLVQVEILSYLAAHKKLQFNTKDKLRTFFKCYFSMMLYNSGGHSLYEFTKPFTLKSIQNLFPPITDFTLENLFLNRNEKAFEDALQSTQLYNASILARTALHHEILPRVL